MNAGGSKQYDQVAFRDMPSRENKTWMMQKLTKSGHTSDPSMTRREVFSENLFQMCPIRDRFEA
jgi:hypothetical protein